MSCGLNPSRTEQTTVVGVACSDGGPVAAVVDHRHGGGSKPGRHDAVSRPVRVSHQRKSRSRIRFRCHRSSERMAMLTRLLAASSTSICTVDIQHHVAGSLAFKRSSSRHHRGHAVIARARLDNAESQEWCRHGLRPQGRAPAGAPDDQALEGVWVPARVGVVAGRSTDAVSRTPAHRGRDPPRPGPSRRGVSRSFPPIPDAVCSYSECVGAATACRTCRRPERGDAHPASAEAADLCSRHLNGAFACRPVTGATANWATFRRAHTSCRTPRASAIRREVRGTFDCRSRLGGQRRRPLVVNRAYPAQCRDVRSWRILAMLIR
jgi:hypothetical protein